MNWEKHRPAEFEYRGKWVNNWFSNMVVDPIEVDGLTWPSVENYYQAMKSDDREVHRRFTTLSPSNAKFEGRKLELKPGWERLKRLYMFNALAVKFTKKEWMDKLIATGDSKIIEWNNWNDKIWGVSIVDNEGENMLGDILMNIREAIKYQIKDGNNTQESSEASSVDIVPGSVN